MNTLSLKLRIPSPRAWFAIAAFFISPLLWAGFSLPTAPVPYTSYPIAWFGSYTLNPGAVLYLQVQAPGETTWRTIGSGTSTYYGAIYIYSRYAFDADGVWSIRTTNGASTTLLVSNSLNQAPVPSITVDGYSSGATVTAGTSVTLRCQATDTNQNLTGIFYNIWNASTGYSDSGGGSFTLISSGTGEITRTITLSSLGDWYFWSTAQDTLGASGSTPAGAAGFKLVVVGGCTVPSYEPSFWNDGGTVQGSNNCYNYANNKRTDSFAQPGLASGQMYSELTCDEVHAAASRDGLIPTDAVSAVPNGFAKIALVVWPYGDYHWYRLDCNGYWTHKPGHTAATNLDNAGNPITNPETANRGPYTSFCGYFLTPTGVAQGSGQANIY